MGGNIEHEVDTGTQELHIDFFGFSSSAFLLTVNGLLSDPHQIYNPDIFFTGGTRLFQMGTASSEANLTSIPLLISYTQE